MKLRQQTTSRNERRIVEHGTTRGTGEYQMDMQAKFPESIKLEITKTVKKDGDEKGERVPVGTVAVLLPTLAMVQEALAQAKVVENSDRKETEFPAFEPAPADYIMLSVYRQICNDVRNKLIPQSAEFQAGKAAPVDWEQLTAESDRSGAALVARNECIKAFAAYLAAEQGKTPAQCEGWKRLLGSPDTLSFQPESVRNLATQYLTAFGASLTPELLARYMPTLTRAEEAASKSADL